MIKVITTKIKVNYNQGKKVSSNFNSNRKYKSGHGGKKSILHLNHAQSKSYDYDGNYYWIKEDDMLYDTTKGFIGRLYVDKEYKFLVYEGKTGTRSVLAITDTNNDFEYKRINIEHGSDLGRMTNEQLKKLNVCGNMYIGYYEVNIKMEGDE